MHRRHFYSVLLASALILLVHTPVFAQFGDPGYSSQSGFAEFTFGESDGGTSCLASWDDNIVWGTAYIDLSSGSVCSGSAAADDDNIVWGTALSEDDNIVWGTAFDDDNIVWGTAFDDDNIVWGTAFEDDNIVWGTSSSFEF